jgi:nitrogen fixation NifU-like protein|tara:strand:+ start:2472 stop:2603 length:132 start_codon:yes stop_codon:yes gene_type:complete
VDDGVVIDAKFKLFGCGAAIVSSAMITVMVKGKTIDKALQISN